MNYRVTVRGLKTLRESIQAGAAELYVDLEVANQKVGDLVREETIARMELQFTTPLDERTGELVASVETSRNPRLTLVPQSGRRVALAVAMGELGDLPYTYWWEYGGDNKSPIGQRYRKVVQGGRSLYPSVKHLYPHIRAIYQVAGERLADRIN